MAQSDDALKLTRHLVGRISPLSDLCRCIDKFGRPFL
jgi:hypothetical protein